MPMTPEQKLEFMDGKLTALAQIVMEMAREVMTRDDFCRTVIPVLEKAENYALHSDTSEAHLMGIRVIRGWVEEQSAPPAPPAATPKRE